VLPGGASGGVLLASNGGTGNFAGTLQDNGTALLSIELDNKASQIAAALG
jgi:hypothetical protein